MKIWTILNGNQVAIRHENFPEGITPSGNVIEGEYPLGKQFIYGEWRDYTKPFIKHVPSSITPRQIRLQLTTAGLRQTIEDWVVTQPLETKDWWEYSTAIERNNEMIIKAATDFGLTHEQLDQFFIDANKL